MNKQASINQGVTCNFSASEDRGRTLHREFVGMVFALAIAEVAVEGAPIANSDLSFRECLPAYAHLALATLIIATSWVGWGRSPHSESDIQSVFSRDFVELLLDLWLVVVYFFIAWGVDARITATAITIEPSLDNEKFWLAIALGTYLLWDVLTKCGSQDLPQRGWASLVCAILGVVAWKYLPNGSVAPNRLLIGDMSLAFLVVLFRAMKRANFSKLTRVNWTWIGVLLLAFILSLLATISFEAVADWWNRPAPVVAPASAGPALP